MQNTFKDRLIEFLSYLNLGQTKFEENVGLGRASISKIKDGMSSPNLAKIIKAYPELNIYWLVGGKGEMLNNAETKAEPNAPDENQLVTYLKEENEKLRNENRQLAEQNGYYKGLLDKEGIQYNKQTAS